jgi:hypothetical protein
MKKIVVLSFLAVSIIVASCKKDDECPFRDSNAIAPPAERDSLRSWLTNTGNVTIGNVAIADANADSITPSTVASIAPGEVVNIIATHTITQADLNNGFVHNTASATGTDPKGDPVTDDSSDPTDPTQPLITCENFIKLQILQIREKTSELLSKLDTVTI